MISANTEWIELIPAGTFSTNDGRGPFWNDKPQQVIQLSRELLAGGLPIDFDHATDRAAPQGLPAPAAGWIREFRIVAGAIQGRVEWTPRGGAALKGKEYRFVSPVFEFDPAAGTTAGVDSGRVIRIRRAALTNNPALSQLPAIAASRVELTAMERKICADMGTSEKRLCGGEGAATECRRREQHHCGAAHRADRPRSRRRTASARDAAGRAVGGREENMRRVRHVGEQLFGSEGRSSERGDKTHDPTNLCRRSSHR